MKGTRQSERVGEEKIKQRGKCTQRGRNDGRNNEGEKKTRSEGQKERKRKKREEKEGVQRERRSLMNTGKINTERSKKESNTREKKGGVEEEEGKKKG